MNRGTAGLAAAVLESGRKRSWREFSGLTAEDVCHVCDVMAEKSGRDFARGPSRTCRLTRAAPRSGSSGGILSREKAGKTEKSSLSHKRVPAGFLPWKKAGKPRNSLFFAKRVPVGLRPARTEAYRGTYVPYIGGMPPYAVAGTSYRTRSSFGCNPGRNPGAIFSSRPSRAIPTRDPSERRMPGGNRDSDIVSEAPSVAAGFPGVATPERKTTILCRRHERRCERSKVASEHPSARRPSGAKKGPVRTGVKWARREGAPPGGLTSFPLGAPFDPFSRSFPLPTRTLGLRPSAPSSPYVPLPPRGGPSAYTGDAVPCNPLVCSALTNEKTRTGSGAVFVASGTFSFPYDGIFSPSLKAPYTRRTTPLRGYYGRKTPGNFRKKPKKNREKSRKNDIKTILKRYCFSGNPRGFCRQ